MKNISITIGIIAVFLGGLVWISGGAGSGGNAGPAFGGLSALSAEERHVLMLKLVFVPAYALTQFQKRNMQKQSETSNSFLKERKKRLFPALSAI